MCELQLPRLLCHSIKSPATPLLSDFGLGSGCDNLLRSEQTSSDRHPSGGDLISRSIPYMCWERFEDLAKLSFKRASDDVQVSINLTPQMLSKFRGLGQYNLKVFAWET